MSSAKTVLVVDDEPDIRELLTMTLDRMDLRSVAAADVETARSLIASQHFDLCLTDMQLPDGDGIELVTELQRSNPEMPVAVITAHGSVDSAVRALKAGAFDFVAKPVRLDDLRNLIQAAMRLPVSNDDDCSDSTQESATVSPISNRLLGVSQAIRQVRELILKLSRSQAPVFINGESGTGKELVARLIHDQGPRASGPFIAVNCGAVPGELMESEFFGHKKGSFTGAHTDKEGFFQAASGGTLFLDEVADLPLPMQVKLLRAIQEKAVRPVGGVKEVSVDVRILSATHKDLSTMVASGEFRQDLFYRLNVIEMTIPPLRERAEDIPELIQFLIKRLSEKNDLPDISIDSQAILLISGYSFPGNVRELENILERACTLCEGDHISANDIILPERPSSTADLSEQAPQNASNEAKADTTNPSVADDSHVTIEIESQTAAASNGIPFEPGNEQLEDYVVRLEREAIVKALDKTKGNKTAAAKLLGITFRALRYKLDKLTID